jgi:predicted nicotinamide N-methyase
MIDVMTSQLLRAVAELEDQVATSVEAGLDGLRLVPVPLAPVVRLHLAQDAVVLWARMEAAAGRQLVAPFWASAWIGGQAVARYVLDHPEIVRGRRVLDLASGSGMVAIAAKMAGAASVIANDIDPRAAAAIDLNARVNDVEITVLCANVLDADAGDAEVVLAGDVFYSKPMADAVMRFLRRAVARGTLVLVGDPGRANLPEGQFKTVATYSAASATVFADAEIGQVDVLRLV